MRTKFYVDDGNPKYARKTHLHSTSPRKGYNPDIVVAFFEEMKIKRPQFEFQFHPDRKWRIDIAWAYDRVALEVQGGIFSGGRHTRGAALLKEWEKLNELAARGWRVLYCQPEEVCMVSTARLILRALAGYA